MAFGERQVFDDLSFSFPPGRISRDSGRQRFGKEHGAAPHRRAHPAAVAGSIIVDGDDITRLSERQMYRVRAKLGMLFQGGALLDSMTVFDNLAFPLRERTRAARAPRSPTRVHATLAAVGSARTSTICCRASSRAA